PEVRVGVGLAGEEVVDEALLVVVLEVLRPPGEVLLVADGRRRHGTKGLAAGAARPVGREYLNVVGEGEELLLEGAEQVLRAAEAGVDPAGGLVEEVRAAEVADEHEVT